MLDLLSRYVGYESWNHYRQQHFPEASVSTAASLTKRNWVMVVVLLLLLGGLLGIYRWMQQPVTYGFAS